MAYQQTDVIIYPSLVKPEDRAEGYSKEEAIRLQNRTFTIEGIDYQAIGRVVGLYRYRFQDEKEIRYGVMTESKLSDGVKLHRKVLERWQFEGSTRRAVWLRGGIADRVSEQLKTNEIPPRSLMLQAKWAGRWLSKDQGRDNGHSR